MVDGFLLPTLALTTLALVIVFAIWSKRRTDRMEHRRTEEKSSLAKDGPGPNPLHEPGRNERD